MTCPDYLARLCAIEARYDGAPPLNIECLAAAGGRAWYRAQRAATQSRYFDQMARNAQKAIQSQRQQHDRPQNGMRLDLLSGDLRSARRQGLRWHDVTIQADRSVWRQAAML